MKKILWILILSPFLFIPTHSANAMCTSDDTEEIIFKKDGKLEELLTVGVTYEVYINASKEDCADKHENWEIAPVYFDEENSQNVDQPSIASAETFNAEGISQKLSWVPRNVGSFRFRIDGDLLDQNVFVQAEGAKTVCETLFSSCSAISNSGICNTCERSGGENCWWNDQSCISVSESEWCAKFQTCESYNASNTSDGYSLCEHDRCKRGCEWKNLQCQKAGTTEEQQQNQPVQPGEDVSFDFSIPNPLGTGSTEATVADLVNQIAGWIFDISIPIAVAVILWAGFLFLTAGAYPKNVDKAKQALTYAVIGLAIIFIGRGFVDLIKSILNVGTPTEQQEEGPLLNNQPPLSENKTCAFPGTDNTYNCTYNPPANGQNCEAEAD